jgi:hypothetical protein
VIRFLVGMATSEAPAQKLEGSQQTMRLQQKIDIAHDMPVRKAEN